MAKVVWKFYKDGVEYQVKDTVYSAWTNVQISSNNVISATDTTYTASDFDIKDLADSQSLRDTWSGKQDAITDLSTIRSWAAKGATSVQPGDNVSTLTNNGDGTNPFITKAADDLVNYYKKTEVYTKEETANLVANFAGFEVVSELPSSDISASIIYLKGPIGSGSDKYEEYIYSNNAWVMIGETSVDLTNYFNKVNDDADDITEWSSHLFMTVAERTLLGNQSGVNTGDETKSSIQTKLGAASASNDGYLSSTDWSAFNAKAETSDIKNSTVTIKKNNTSVGSFTLNQSTAADINIEVPTKVTDLSDASNYAKTADLATVATSGKASDLTNDAFVALSGNQTVAGTKTFSTSPVVPSKTAAATNSWTAIATEAQVYTVAQAVVTLGNAIDGELAEYQKKEDVKENKFVTAAQYALITDAATDGHTYFIYEE